MKANWLTSPGSTFRSNDALNALQFAEPTAAAILGHKDCRYVPHALAVRVGQAILISNDDPTIHNTHPAPATTRSGINLRLPDHSH